MIVGDLDQIFQDQSERLKALIVKLKLTEKKQRLKELEQQTSQPNFWQNQEQAQLVVKDMARLKAIVEPAQELEAGLTQALELSALATTEDQGFLTDEVKKLEKQLAQLEKQTYLNGDYDANDAIISIHAGQGGTEAMDWSEMLFRMYTRYVESRDWKWFLIAESRGEEAGIKSVTFQVEADYAYGYLRREAGTHRLVRQSPFNADNLRQTSFSLVEVLPVLGEVKDIELDPKDLEVQFFRSSSQGGQNVQKVSTAVRLKHKPSGMVVEAQTQRYQEQNRKLAEQLLKARLWQLKEEERQKQVSNLKESHQSASWGTQIRSYVLHPYKLVKDLRTKYESKNPEAVLDGDLTAFIEAELSLLA